MLHNKINPLLVLAIFLFLPTVVTADRVDSLEAKHDTMLVRYFLYQTDSLDMGKLYREATAQLEGFQRYDPLDRTGFYASPGNVGLAHKPLIYQPNIYEGFSFGLHSFDQFIATPANARYYLHNRPVSYLSYFNGPQKEQLFRAMISHRIFKMVTFSADFSLINSPGTYFHQKSDNKNLLLTGQYYTRDKRLGVLANYTWNKILVQENGGIINDSIFELDLETDRGLIDVNLQTAENLLIEKGTYLDAYFFISKENVSDSNVVKPKTFHAGRISYSLDYKVLSQLYSDTEPLAGLYAPFDPVLDSTETHDSLHISKLENSFSWSNIRLGEDFQQKFLYVNFAFKHQYVTLKGYADKRTFTQLIPSADIRIHPFKVLTIGGHGHYILGDYNNNGFLIKALGKLEINLTKAVRGILDAEVGFANQQAGYFYSYYQSNHFRWDTTFDKQNFRWFSASLTVWKFKLGAKYTSVSDLVYLGEDAKPEQYPENIDILQFSWHQDFRWKAWNLDLDIYYQAASKDVLHLPALAGRGSLYVTLPLFQNAAILQPGLDAFYNTAYYSDAYMPAFRNFYWQDGKSTGNYVYLDVFINLMVKRFRVYIQYQNLGSLWSKSRYYMVPHYPMQDAAFKWGLSWRFYD